MAKSVNRFSDAFGDVDVLASQRQGEPVPEGAIAQAPTAADEPAAVHMSVRGLNNGGAGDDIDSIGGFEFLASPMDEADSYLVSQQMATTGSSMFLQQDITLAADLGAAMQVGVNPPTSMDLARGDHGTHNAADDAADHDAADDDDVDDDDDFGDALAADVLNMKIPVGGLSANHSGSNPDLTDTDALDGSTGLDATTEGSDNRGGAGAGGGGADATDNDELSDDDNDDLWGGRPGGRAASPTMSPTPDAGLGAPEVISPEEMNMSLPGAGTGPRPGGRTGAAPGGSSGANAAVTARAASELKCLHIPEAADVRLTDHGPVVTYPEVYMEEKLAAAAAAIAEEPRARSFSRFSKHGMLTKEGYKRKSWKRRYFILHDHVLYYYVNINDAKPLGAISLLDGYCLLPALDKRANAFQLYHDSARSYYMAADTVSHRNAWMKAIRPHLCAGGVPTVPVLVDAGGLEEAKAERMHAELNGDILMPAALNITSGGPDSFASFNSFMAGGAISPPNTGGGGGGVAAPASTSTAGGNGGGVGEPETSSGTLSTMQSFGKGGLEALRSFTASNNAQYGSVRLDEPIPSIDEFEQMLKDRLTAGGLFMKTRPRGAPHIRHVFASPDLEWIMWKDPKKPSLTRDKKKSLLVSDIQKLVLGSDEDTHSWTLLSSSRNLELEADSYDKMVRYVVAFEYLIGQRALADIYYDAYPGLERAYSVG